MRHLGVPAVLLLAFGAVEARAQAIEGKATYRERMALPPGAVFEATLEEVPRADAAASVVATLSVASPGNPPIAFRMAYDPADVVPTHRYVVRAQIIVNGVTLFASDTAVPVLTQGAPNKVELVLRRVTAGGSAGAAAVETPGAPMPPAPKISLQNTAWRLVRFQGADGTTLVPGDPEHYTVQFLAKERVAVRLDCNRGSGTWKADGVHLELGPMALTRAACVPGSLHDRLVTHWPFIRSFAIEKGHLFLLVMADGGAYELEPRQEKP